MLRYWRPAYGAAHADRPALPPLELRDFLPARASSNLTYHFRLDCVAKGRADCRYLAEGHASRRIDGRVEGNAVLAPILDDGDVRRCRARDAQAGVDHGSHRSSSSSSSESLGPRLSVFSNVDVGKDAEEASQSCRTNRIDGKRLLSSWCR